MRTSLCLRALLATFFAGSALAAAAPAASPPPSTAASHFTLDAARSSLEFTFLQAGAKNTGRFPRFTAALDCPNGDPAGGKLEVTVDVAALDTGDKDRDETLRGEDLFAVKKYPQATFDATRITKSAGGYDAVGPLTIRGVTRETHVPFTFRETTEGGAAVGYMRGSVVVRRLDFGVGQGDWKATDQAGNEVTVSFNLRLVRAAH